MNGENVIELDNTEVQVSDQVEMRYPVVEIFSSIQGEGCLMGTPATFIRLGGCNLACPWCDTKKSWTTEGYPMMTADEILEKCDKHLVVITGGEPLIHDLFQLVAALNLGNKYVALETNGTLELPDEVNSLIHWVACAPKPPMYELNLFPNELKFVVGSDEESSPEKIAEVINRLKPSGKVAGKVAIWLQPESSNWGKHIGLCYELAMSRPILNCRVGMQMHKVINDSTSLEVE